MEGTTQTQPKQDTPTGAQPPAGSQPPSSDVRRPREEPDERSGTELIDAAAKGRSLSKEEAADALEWFLSDDPMDEAEYHKALELNVGGPEKDDEPGIAVDADNPPQWIRWVICPVDLDTLRRIRRANKPNTRRRRGGGDGEVDEVEANLQIVFEGTVDPDLRKAAAQMKDRDGHTLASPKEALRRRFRRKPGLLGQIAGEIMSLSGYDDEDVRDAAAAGNS